MDKPKLLIVEDNSETREQMRWAFDDAFEVHLAGTSQEALVLMKRERPSLVTLDLGLPPESADATVGLALLEELLAIDRIIKVIVITGNSERANALAAIQKGAYDFIEKPIQVEVLKVILQRAAYVNNLEQENRDLQSRIVTRAFHEMIGASLPMQRLFETIQRVAASDLPVLICGESGSGKELVARAIHQQSRRREQPFIVINCGAIPETLLESELFGYEKGAYTGAYQQQRGKLEYADGGTLLLDEIAEMKMGLQVKLLRFLQDGRLERIGGRESIAVNTRILAATNADIKAVLEQGLFREDLYFRLGVVEIHVPPLRERGEDVVLLAEAFVLRYRDELNQRVTGLSQEAREAIRAYSWPGNARELENRIKRAIVMTKGRLLHPADLELEGSTAPLPSMTLKEARSQIEKDLIQQALIRKNWNITRAAEELGISRETLRESIQKYGLDKPA